MLLRYLFNRGIKLDAPIMGQDNVAVWNQIGRTGSFKGHSAGPFELTTKELAEMVRNFRDGGEEIPIVLGHPDDEQPAYGWIHDLELRGEELWALTEWSEEIVPLIRSGKFRGCSMVFSTDSIDRETAKPIGAELYELGVTNRPFLSDMQPLAASRRPARRRPALLKPSTHRELRLKMNIDKKKIMEALDELPKDAGPEQFHMALEAALLTQAALEKPEKSEVPEMPAEPTATEASVELASAPEAIKAAESESIGAPEDAGAAAKDQIVGALEKALGMDMAGILAFVQDNGDKLAALAKSEPPSGTPADDNAEKAASRADLESIKLSALEARLEAANATVAQYHERIAAYEKIEQAHADAALIGLVDHAVESGHILPTHRETFIKLGRLDRSELERELERFKAAPAVITRKLVNPKPVGESAVLDAQDDTERDIIRLLSHSPESVRKDAIARHRGRTKKISDRV